jgi:hypothetical protein
METKPIKPTDISPELENIIPDVVIQAVNALLKDKYTGGLGSFTIKQDEIISKIRGLDGSLTRNEIFEKKMLNFEPLYRKNGWSVKYDKPAWDENYEPYFEFTPKAK